MTLEAVWWDCGMTLRINFKYVAGIAAALMPAIASAQRTWHVDDDACPVAGTGEQINPFCSIQTAIEHSLAGDTISVAPGTYTENINYLGKNIAVISTSGPDETTLTNAEDDRVVRFNGGEGRAGERRS